MKDLIKVRIDKATDQMWYENQLGSVFNVEDFSFDRFTLNLVNSKYVILKSDCTVIEGEKDEPKAIPYNEKLLIDMWNKRNPSHEYSQEGKNLFWKTAFMVFEDYLKALPHEIPAPEPKESNQLKPVTEPVLIAKAGEKVRIVDLDNGINVVSKNKIYELSKDLHEGDENINLVSDHPLAKTFILSSNMCVLEKVKVSEEPVKEESEPIHFNWLDFRSGKYDVVEKGTLFPINIDMPMSKFINMIDNLKLIPRTQTVWVNVYHSSSGFNDKVDAQWSRSIGNEAKVFIETIEVKRPVK